MPDLTQPFVRRCLRLVFSLVLMAGAAAVGEAKERSRVPPPVFSVSGGAFTNDVTLRLETTVPATTVRFTLDGTEPTAAAPSFTAPLVLTNTVVVRARAFTADGAMGVVVSHSYILLEAELLEFHSNLPLVILNSFGREIPHEAKLVASARIIDLRDHRATLLGAAQWDGRGLVNIRGRASLRYPKRSYTLKVVDEEDEALQVSPLGLPKESDWVLYAPYPDKTLMRDVLAYELSNQIGRWAPRTRFVEVFVNESGGKLKARDYVGVYVLEEKVKRDKNRVNMERLDLADNAEPNVSGGYIFKKDHRTGDLGPVTVNPGGFPTTTGGSSSVRVGFPTGPGGFPGDPAGFQPPYQGSVRTVSSSSSRSSRVARGAVTNYLGAAPPRPVGRERVIVRTYDEEEDESTEETRFRDGWHTSRTNHLYYVEPEPDEITAVQRAWLANYVNRFETALYGPDFRDPATGYAAYIDAASFVDFHLLAEVTKNVDAFRFSTFYHKDRGGRIQMGPLWDWNLSLGNCNGKQGWLPEWWLWPQLNDREYCWFRRLFEDPDFAQLYVDRWTELRGSVFATTNFLARVDEIAAQLREPQQRNFQRWPILGMNVNPNYFVGETYADEVNWMKGWISNRVAWIDRQFVAPPTFSAGPDGKLTLASDAGKIYFTVDGSDPRLSGGEVSPKARVYEAAIAAGADARLMARVLVNHRWSGPALSGIKPSLRADSGPR